MYSLILLDYHSNIMLQQFNFCTIVGLLNTNIVDGIKYKYNHITLLLLMKYLIDFFLIDSYGLKDNLGEEFLAL